MLSTSVRYFLEVARCGSINAAAENLHVAGSAISRQIAKLEHQLGAPLFERRARGMILSAAGEVLAACARRSALEAERVSLDISDLKDLRSGIVRLACVEGFAIDLLPEAIQKFRQSHSGVRFELRSAPPPEIERLVREGDVDIGMNFSVTEERDVHVAFETPSPIGAAVSPDHPLAAFKSIRLADLSPYPVALQETGFTVRQLFDLACAMEGLQIEPALTTNNVVAIYSFARVAGGVALTGALALRSAVARGELVHVPIENPVFQRRRVQLVTMMNRTLPHAPASFLRFLVEELR